MLQRTRSLRTAVSAGWIAGPLALSCFLAAPVGAGNEPVGPRDEEAEVAAFVAEALEKSPELVAARQDAAAAAARVKPAGALPDPVLSLSYENDGAKPSLGTEPMTRLNITAQQTLPFPGKLDLAGRVATADAGRYATRPARLALSIEAAVRRSYADLLEAREDLRIVDEQIGTWREIEGVIRARYGAGMGTQQDVLRAQSEQTRLLQQRRRDEAAERTAETELCRLLYRPASSAIPTARRLVPGRVEPPPSAGEYLEQALSKTPELAEIALAKDRARLAADLARRNTKPDFLAWAGYSNRGDLPLMWSAGVGVSIPLWAGRKQRPLIAEADSLLESATATEASLRRQAEARTQERLIRIEQLAAEAKLDAEGVLAQDRLSVDAALASYRTGSVPFVTVLEALGTYFADRRTAVTRLASLIRAEADLNEFSLDVSSALPSSAGPTGGAAAPRM